MQIIMPKPLGSMYCRSVYLCYDESAKEKAYFTVEQTSSGEYYICSWLDNGAHVIYTEAPVSINDEIDYVQTYFQTGFNFDDAIAVSFPN